MLGTASRWFLLPSLAGMAAFLQLVPLCIGLPESPRWLLHRGLSASAADTLATLRGGRGATERRDAQQAALHSELILLHEHLSAEHEPMSSSDVEETCSSNGSQYGYGESSPANLRALIGTVSTPIPSPALSSSPKACRRAAVPPLPNHHNVLLLLGAMLLQQFSGAPLLLSYSAMLLTDAGASDDTVLAAIALAGTIQILMILATLRILPAFSRRKVLLSSLGGSALALTLLMVGLCRGVMRTLGAAPAALALALHATTFGAGLGPCPWLLPAELFDLTFQLRASQLAAVTHFLGCYLASQGFPVLYAALKAAGAADNNPLFSEPGTASLLPCLLVTGFGFRWMSRMPGYGAPRGESRGMSLRAQWRGGGGGSGGAPIASSGSSFSLMSLAPWSSLNPSQHGGSLYGGSGFATPGYNSQNPSQHGGSIHANAGLATPLLGRCAVGGG